MRQILPSVRRSISTTQPDWWSVYTQNLVVWKIDWRNENVDHHHLDLPSLRFGRCWLLLGSFLQNESCWAAFLSLAQWLTVFISLFIGSVNSVCTAAGLWSVRMTFLPVCVLLFFFFEELPFSSNRMNESKWGGGHPWTELVFLFVGGNSSARTLLVDGKSWTAVVSCGMRGWLSSQEGNKFIFYTRWTKTKEQSGFWG